VRQEVPLVALRTVQHHLVEHANSDAKLVRKLFAAFFIFQWRQFSKFTDALLVLARLLRGVAPTAGSANFRSTGSRSA
jgi:hypothetical protein